jgi:uracil DNA glycosylase
MEFVALGLLTIGVVSCIIILKVRNKNKKLSHTVYRQTDMHKMLKTFFDMELFDKGKKISQLTKHKKRDTIKVVILGNSAYWVSDNIFYIANAVNGKVLPETSKPVDIENMPKKELDKMLSILDTLRDGESDDSSGSRDE